MKQMRAEDQFALDMSLRDACKVARRLVKCSDSQAHSAALAFIRVLVRLGAKEIEDQQNERR